MSRPPPQAPAIRVGRGLRVGVIGGGPAGVTAAFETVKAYAQATLIEVRHEVDGRARSVEFGGRTWRSKGACASLP